MSLLAQFQAMVQHPQPPSPSTAVEILYRLLILFLLGSIWSELRALRRAPTPPHA